MFSCILLILTSVSFRKELKNLAGGECTFSNFWPDISGQLKLQIICSYGRYYAGDVEDDDSEACNPIINGGNVDDTVNYIKEKVLTRAESYSNKQIQEYIDQYF